MNERLLASTDAAVAALAKRGRLRAARLAPPEMPRPFADALARVLALEAGSARATTLESHYLELMPKMRVEQLATTEAPASTFFGARLDWSRLPRLAAALARLQALLADAAAPPVATDGETLGDFYQSTFYGAHMPLLYGAPSDLAHFAAATGDLDSVLDAYLTAPLIHELTHLGRQRAAFPLYIDECVAGWLGVQVLPEFAFPDGTDDAIFAAPWFAQVGQTLARVAGPRALLRAHAGVEPWATALPAGLAAALDRLGWEDYVESRRLHLLSDNFRPEPWLKAMYLAAAGASLDGHTLSSLRALPWAEVPPGDESPLDAAMLSDGLRAMCLHNYQTQRSFRVLSRPPPGPIVVDAVERRISTPGGEHDPVPLGYLLPPSIAARLPHGYVVELRSLDAVLEVSRAILDGAAPRQTANYTLSRLK